MKIEIWTDGSSGGGVSTGGWGFITDDSRLKRCGGAYETTNQRMELTAAGKGLRSVLQDTHYANITEVEVVSDSRYLVDCMTKKWYVKWEYTGWITSAREPVKNADLWRALIALFHAWEARGVTPTFRWVRGHVGEPLNEAADELARTGKEKAKALEALRATQID